MIRDGFAVASQTKRMNISIQRAAVIVGACALVSAFAFACEPEVGMPCDDDPARVTRLVDVAPGTDNLVRDVTLRNCTQALCLTTDGSRPYCTIACEADAACPTAEGFRCANATPFGDGGLVCVGSPDVIAARDEAMGRTRAALLQAP